MHQIEWVSFSAREAYCEPQACTAQLGPKGNHTLEHRLDGASGIAPPKPRIFLLEDDDAVRDSMQLLLEVEGYVARVFQTVASFMNELAVANPLPHCVIADVDLPDGDGRDVAAHLGEYQPALPIILVSGKSIEDLEANAITGNLFAFFTKPLELSALFDAIERAIALSWGLSSKDL